MKAKKIVLVAHCVINQNCVVDGLSRARGAYPITELLIREGIGIIQLPCPELIYNGIERPPLSYDDYNTKEYRAVCRSLLRPYVRQIKNYLESGYTFLGIIAINNSPSCSMSGVRGVLVTELISILDKENIALPFVEIPESYREGANSIELEENIIMLIRS